MLELHFHPLASWCWKVLIALYENQTPFEPKHVDLMDPAEREALERLWPFGKFPVLHDPERGRTVAESSIVIEYLSAHYPGPVELIPTEPELALEARLRDRIYDFHVHDLMNRIVFNRLRPEEHRDSYGSERLKADLQKHCATEVKANADVRPCLAKNEATLIAAIDDIDREAVGAISARQYTSQQPRFTLFALATFAVWTGAAGLKVGTPWFGRIP